MKIKLIALDGILYFPTGGERNDGPSMLIRRYEVGDCDTCPWPMSDGPGPKKDTLMRRLASALFDERECNPTFPADADIQLPDGTSFDFDLYIR